MSTLSAVALVGLISVGIALAYLALFGADELQRMFWMGFVAGSVGGALAVKWTPL